MQSKALIYADEGVSPVSVRYLSHSFKENGIPYQLVDAPFLKNEGWEQACSFLVMPGGRDIPYHEALKGRGNQKIRRFLEEGGIYLGICAGAYYACASFEFEKDHPLEVKGVRELAFYPGVAVGPAYGPGQFAYNSEKGARQASLLRPDQTRFSAYFNGGCAFPQATIYATVDVMASYADLPGCPPAIVKCRVGKGHALLSGVHLEYPGSNFFPLLFD